MRTNRSLGKEMLIDLPLSETEGWIEDGKKGSS